jgi:SAM-dependent methyltransferase
MKTERFDKKYAQYYDLFNKNKDYSKEIDFLEKVFKKYAIAPIKSILDLGCGTGIHDESFALKGYEVTGLDLSQDMLDIAKSKNIANAEFINGDLSDFKIDKKFDACICMFASFGYITENKQIKSSFKSIKKHLNPKGLFVLDVWNGLGVMKEPPSSRTKEVEVNDLKIIRTSFPKLDALNHVSNVKFDVKVFENENVIDSYEENHKVRFFFPMEMKKYLEDAGFELLEICKTYELDSKVDESVWNMVLIARLKE